MMVSPDAYHRRSIRLPGYDYTQCGAYFVTICTQNKECVLGDVVDGEMRVSVVGQIAEACWCAIPEHFLLVELDEFVVMPNHLHGILVIRVGATHASPLQKRAGPESRSLGAIVGSFKSAATKRLNILRGTPGAVFWQRNYYEHIVRSENELSLIREYIAQNPARWTEDENHPSMRK